MAKIALTGRAYSGKSTHAELLEAEGDTLVLRYSDGYIKPSLARALADETGKPQADWLGRLKAEKATYRQLLAEWARAIGVDDGEGVDELVEAMHDALRHVPVYRHVVFDNVRYPAQWEPLKQAGFTLVRLEAPQEMRYERARAAGFAGDLYDFDFEVNQKPEEHAMDGVPARFALGTATPVAETHRYLRYLLGVIDRSATASVAA